jgi:NAD(P)H-dependent FMN reductase
MIMSSDPIRVAVIIGSVRQGRFGPTVANWFVSQVQQRDDFQVDLIDLADYDLPTMLADEPTPEVGAALGVVTPRLAQAEAFVVVTPEYNHSFPASLKSAIDWHFVEWTAKPIGMVSYGGLAGGLRAVEHLRQVFAELHAVTIRDTVSFHNPGDQFDDQGELKDPTAANAAAKTLLDQLAWWALALREARAKRPYQA